MPYLQPNKVTEYSLVKVLPMKTSSSVKMLKITEYYELSVARLEKHCSVMCPTNIEEAAKNID